MGASTSNNRRVAVNSPGMFSVDRPWAITLQPRQVDNTEFGFPDQFAVQVVTTARDRLVIRVRRVDADAGWGQPLKIDLIAIDDGSEPP